MKGKGGKRRGPMHFSPTAQPTAQQPAAARPPRALPPDRVTPHEPESPPEAPPDTLSPPAPKGSVRWPLRLLLWAASLLAALTAALALDSLVRTAFQRAGWLGWAALFTVSLAALAAMALLLRELMGLLRLRRTVKLRRLAERTLSSPEEKDVRALARAFHSLYHKRPDMRWAFDRLRTHESALLTPAERLRLLELELLTPLDAQARRLILRAARDVAALTAITPGAALDMAIVFLRNLRMLRQLAALYGGRPGFLGGWKLLRMVLAHLAVTGALALSDAFLPHVLGKGLAGRLSARFGEGVLNGLLTARIGLAALDQVRPLPFAAVEKPGLRELAAALVRENSE